MRIGTWNVQYARGVEKNRLRVRHLLAQRADVWVLTETHDDLDLSATHTALRSDQRYPLPGGRWTTVWTSLPVIEELGAEDSSRCVAVRLDAGPVGDLVVHGTVLPWNGDRGNGWQEFYRVVPEQGAEWAALRTRFPDATLVVAGDLNHDLGGRHYYGTKVGRPLLSAALEGAGLTCLTSTDRFADGVLAHPPIDHVCVGARAGWVLTSEATGWDRAVGGTSLSDHGGTLVELELRPQT